MVGAAFKKVLGLEMAAHAIRAGDGMYRDQLVLLIHPVQTGQSRMQAIVAAEVEQPLGHGATQSGPPGIAVRHHYGHTIHGAALDDHDEPFVPGCGCQRERRPAERGGGGESQ